MKYVKAPSKWSGRETSCGFKVNFIPFKLCPVIFTVSAVLILLGIYL